MHKMTVYSAVAVLLVAALLSTVRLPLAWEALLLFAGRAYSRLAACPSHNRL